VAQHCSSLGEQSVSQRLHPASGWDKNQINGSPDFIYRPVQIATCPLPLRKSHDTATIRPPAAHNGSSSSRILEGSAAPTAESSCTQGPLRVQPLFPRGLVYSACIADTSERTKQSLDRTADSLEQSFNLSRRCHDRDYPTLGNFAPQPVMRARILPQLFRTGAAAQTLLNMESPSGVWYSVQPRFPSPQRSSATSR
jgi:hypothetical protein